MNPLLFYDNPKLAKFISGVSNKPVVLSHVLKSCIKQLNSLEIRVTIFLSSLKGFVNCDNPYVVCNINTSAS